MVEIHKAPTKGLEFQGQDTVIVQEPGKKLAWKESDIHLLI